MYAHLGYWLVPAATRTWPRVLAAGSYRDRAWYLLCRTAALFTCVRSTRSVTSYAESLQLLRVNETLLRSPPTLGPCEQWKTCVTYICIYIHVLATKRGVWFGIKYITIIDVRNNVMILNHILCRDGIFPTRYMGYAIITGVLKTVKCFDFSTNVK